MDLKDFRAGQWEITSRASDVARQLAFAGVAAAWVMRSGNGALAAGLRWPIALLVLVLALDFLQYAWAAAVWPFWTRLQEKRGATGELFAPRWFNWPTNVFFYGKMVVLAAGYGMLLRYAAWQLL